MYIQGVAPSLAAHRILCLPTARWPFSGYSSAHLLTAVMKVGCCGKDMRSFWAACAHRFRLCHKKRPMPSPVMKVWMPGLRTFNPAPQTLHPQRCRQRHRSIKTLSTTISALILHMCKAKKRLYFCVALAFRPSRNTPWLNCQLTAWAWYRMKPSS
jgi:hypothetical protein